jgi:hypothetical protein
MITEQKSTSQWQPALEKHWKGCAAVRITLEQTQPGDVIFAKYDRPAEEDSPPREYRDSTAIFVVLKKHDESARDIPAMEIARLSHTGDLLGSMSWGTTTLPKGAKFWLLGSCCGERVSNARWVELSLNESNNPIIE